MYGNMNKPFASIKQIDFDQDWMSHPIVEWLSSHKKLLLGSFFAVLIVLIVTYRLLAIRTLNAETDFFQAQTLFTKFQQAEVPSQDASSELKQLDVLMQRYPELKPKYEGSLAQTLLISGQASQARTFADDIFQRTESDRLQPYQYYSHISLLIAAGNYSEALQKSEQLKLALEKSTEDLSFLYFFNLIRLAMLYQEAGEGEKEWKTWEQVMQPKYENLRTAANQVLQLGQASLNQYIEERGFKYSLNV